MVKNYDIFCIKNGYSLEKLNEFMEKNFILSCYVIDEEKKYVGIIGKKEYIKSKECGNVIINFNGKFVIQSNHEQDSVKEIFRSDTSINRIPILGKNREILYEYVRDILEDTVQKLRETGITIGEYVKIYDSNIDTKWGPFISIGNRVTISCASILAHDASMQGGLGKVKIGRVIIKDDVFIGYHSIILPNVTIGNKVIVGAGTVVAKDIPDNSVCLGNPMKIIGSWDDYMKKHQKQIESSPVFELRDINNLDNKKRISSKFTKGIGYVY